MAAPVVDRVPSSERVVPGSINIPIAQWPTTGNVDEQAIDALTISSEAIDSFNLSLQKKDYKAIADLFVDDGYWRDYLSLTWDLRTVKGKESIIKLLQDGHHLVSVGIDHSASSHGPQVANLRHDGSVRGIQFFTIVTTQFGSGQGVMWLIQESGKWKIWLCFTSLTELKDHEEAIGSRRAHGVLHGAQAGRKNWLERRQAESNFEDSEPDVLIIGAGQAGLSVHARLRMLNVPTLTIDQTDEIGDVWRNRYHQLMLNGPTWYNHMPYINFPASWPIFTPKDKLADFLNSYAQMLELNVWTKAELDSSSWDDKKKQWTVVLRRKNSDGSTETRTLHPKHIIQATGNWGKTKFPEFKGKEHFKGDVLCHSSKFRGARKNTDGRKAVVIGSSNSALDIAQDYYENGYDVTIIQRSSTIIMSSKSVLGLLLGTRYYEGGPPVEHADLLSWSVPQEVSKAMHADMTTLHEAQDREILDGLNKAGFKTNRGPMNCGLWYSYLQRGGGHYIDIGTCQLIIDGKVKVKHGHGVDEILPNGVRLDDGTELEADEIICATGYENMRTATEEIFGAEVGSKVGNVWGLNEEGEIKVMWRRSGHPGLWLHGGDLAMCRYFSRIVALQIKAQLEGLSS